MEIKKGEYEVILKAADGKAIALTPEVLPEGKGAVLFKTNIMLKPEDAKQIEKLLSVKMDRNAVLLPPWVVDVVILPDTEALVN